MRLPAEAFVGAFASRRAGRGLRASRRGSAPIFFSRHRKENGRGRSKEKMPAAKPPRTERLCQSAGVVRIGQPGADGPVDSAPDLSRAGLRSRIRWRGAWTGWRPEPAYFCSRAFRFATRCPGAGRELGGVCKCRASAWRSGRRGKRSRSDLTRTLSVHCSCFAGTELFKLRSQAQGRRGHRHPPHRFARPPSWTNLRRRFVRKASFLLDRARPVFFSARRKENGGVHSPGNSRFFPELPGNRQLLK